ncbi:hypothetical protein SBA3_2380003 [Candidatus Sulfopaludibacter sp. SbA3]|nr:hypothetical protein SBA3_2380003 [Candidatus Sulfopaludibacter sp. SbA3]
MAQSCRRQILLVRYFPRRDLRHLRRRTELPGRHALSSRVLQSGGDQQRLPRQSHGQDLVERTVDGLAAGSTVRRVFQRGQRRQTARQGLDHRRGDGYQCGSRVFVASDQRFGGGPQAFRYDVHPGTESWRRLPEHGALPGRLFCPLSIGRGAAGLEQGFAAGAAGCSYRQLTAGAPEEEGCNEEYQVFIREDRLDGDARRSSGQPSGAAGAGPFDRHGFDAGQPRRHDVGSGRSGQGQPVRPGPPHPAFHAGGR